jgi:YbbR domain-containing protein
MSWLRTTGLRLLLSLGLAFSLWVYVSYRENPNTSIPYEDVPVEVEGLAPGLVVVDQSGLPRKSSTVKVTAEGEQQLVATVRASDVKAFADLSNLGPGDYQVPVNVGPTRSGLARIEFTADPSLLQFRIEQEITTTVPLTATVTGNVPFSFERRDAQVTVNEQPVGSIEIRGPESRVERVVQARVTVNVDRLTANYESPRPVEPIDASGDIVEGVTITPTTVDVLVPIVSSAGIKRVPIVPQVVGQPSPGYVVSGVTVEPAFVSLTGSSGPLDNVLSISTQNVDVAGASSTISQTVELLVPVGVSLLSSEPSQVTVSVRLQRIERPFTVTLPAEVIPINSPPGLIVGISPQAVQVTLTGDATAITAIGETTLQGTVDLRNVQPGTYSLAPSFDLPEGITLANEPRVTVTLRVPPSPVPTNEPTTTPEPTTEPPAEQLVSPTATSTTSPPTATAAPTTAGTAAPASSSDGGAPVAQTAVPSQ